MRKTAFITGGSRGIGAGIARVLAANGYDLAITYHTSPDGAEATAAECRALGAEVLVLQADVSRVADIDRAFAAFEAARGDELDLLVNNAGITRFKPLLETDEALFDQLNNTDWKGSFFCTQRAAKLMVHRGRGGVVVNITSNQQQGCWPDSVVYGPVKAALKHFTEAAALNLAPYGIRVVAVAPGYTARVRTEDVERIKPITDRIPLHRFCTPEEVGHAVQYLASDEAGYVTGVCLAMDGGAILPVVAQNAYI